VTARRRVNSTSLSNALPASSMHLLRAFCADVAGLNVLLLVVDLALASIHASLCPRLSNCGSGSRHEALLYSELLSCLANGIPVAVEQQACSLPSLLGDSCLSTLLFAVRAFALASLASTIFAVQYSWFFSMGHCRCRGWCIARR